MKLSFLLFTVIFPERFKTVPKPLNDAHNSFGVHPVVCCPEPLAESAICFESDPWCETYVKPEYPEYEAYDGEAGGEYPEYGGEAYDYLQLDPPTVSNCYLTTVSQVS